MDFTQNSQAIIEIKTTSGLRLSKPTKKSCIQLSVTYDFFVGILKIFTNLTWQTTRCGLKLLGEWITNTSNNLLQIIPVFLHNTVSSSYLHNMYQIIYIILGCIQIPDITSLRSPRRLVVAGEGERSPPPNIIL